MGAFGGLGDQIRVSVVSDSSSLGWKLCLELLWTSHKKSLIISLKKQFFCGKMDLSIGSYMLILHIICFLQVTFFVQ